MTQLSKKKCAVFLDRDGVITHESMHYDHGLRELGIIKGAPEAIRLLNEKGVFVVVVTNQAGVAKGILQEEDIHVFNNEMKKRLMLSGARLDAIYYCPHHPEAVVAKYRIFCECRKPGSGMLERAAEELDIDLMRSFIVGDKWTDIEAGKKVGCAGIMVRTGHGNTELKKEEMVKADFIAADLLEATDFVIKGLLPNTISTAH